tara:strand:- start:2479 stop:3534 length:1056 start_codon:yes stop_codon:yes gene_type:complete
MQLSRVVEYVFFFGLLGLAGYMVWQIMAPFITALALSAVIVTICQPLYDKIRNFVPKRNKSAAAFLSTLVVLFAIIVPLVLITSLIVNEVLAFYEDFDSGGMSVQSSISALESTVRTVIPDFNVDLNKQVKATAEWVTGNIGQIFAGTVSVIFIFFISLIGSFYFFRDGRELLELVIKASPLPDHEDKIIFERMARAVRAVATGTLFVAMIQGTLVAVGFSLFGIDRAILWGSVASVGALIPGIGTTIVTAPAIIYLFFAGEMISGIGLLIWSALIVGLVDNLVGPYLISRGNNLHPFIILISVLGGISLFGPVGFVVGPVIVTLFIVLLEIYNQYIVQEQRLSETEETEL